MMRLLPYEVLSGAANMAADEALLLAAVEGHAALRFYSWREPTASLGYFQPAANKPLGLPFVRRSTGGGTIIHHHDLTYALALPAGEPWHNAEPWPCRMHHILQAGLNELGIATETVVCGLEQKLGDALCFEDQTAGDLRLKGHKVAGSAQRKWKGAVLQHGSLLLASSPFAPTLPGLAELSGIELEPQALAVHLSACFFRTTGWKSTLRDWTAAEYERREEIEAEKYGHNDWGQKR